MHDKRMGTWLLALAGLCAVGCGPQAKFKAETFELAQGTLHVKGWQEGGVFCIEVRFKPKAKDLTLHSVALVTPAGQTQYPDSWKDKTAKAPPISVGLGMGIPLGGGHEVHPGDASNHPLSLGPGLSVPLGSGGKAVTAVDACWNVSATTQTDPVTACTLQIKVIALGPGFARVTTIPLAMTVSQETDDEPASTTPPTAEPTTTTPPTTTTNPPTGPTEPTTPPDKKPPSDDNTKEATKALIREIDFTLKSPPTTKTTPR